MDFFDGIDLCLGGYTPAYRVFHRHVPLYYGIQYNHSGPMRLRLDHGEEYRHDGACVFVSHPGSFFEYGSPDRLPRQHIFVCFRGPRVERYIAGGLLPLSADKPLRPVIHAERFRRAMLDLVEAVHSRRSNHNRMVLMLEDVLLQLHEQDDPDLKIPACHLPSFAELLEKIGRNPEKAWDFNREAAKLNMTPTHFRRLFRLFSGNPPRQYVLEQRLRQAAGLLVRSTASVGETAAAAGFDDIYYFSRAFKERYAVSPLAYRREFAGK